MTGFLIAVGCSGPGATDAGTDAPSAGGGSDTGVVDAGTDAAPQDAGRDAASLEDTGFDAPERDAAPLPFEAIAPCGSPDDYRTGFAFVAAYDSYDYDPRCLRVRAGTTVTIEANDDHPLAPRADGSPGSPIPSTSESVAIRFDAPGFYPYLCTLHDTLGMIGVVQVEP